MNIFIIPTDKLVYYFVKHCGAKKCHEVDEGVKSKNSFFSVVKHNGLPKNSIR